VRQAAPRGRNVCALSRIFDKKRRLIAATVGRADAMDITAQPARNQLPFESIALVLQGGGALGAYQAGVFQALAEAGIEPDWISGISIGAFNSAVIAGNPPEARVEKLRQFWEAITEPYVQWPAPFPPPGAAPPPGTSVAPQPSDFWTLASGLAPTLNGDIARGFLNQWAAGRVLFNGTPGFFALRPVTPWFWPGSSIRATSYYDTTDLKRTLERLVDFDRINSQTMRLSVGAVNVQTGNFVYFDTTKDRIRPEHIMASGALPPAFAAVEIDGEYYWDGGLVSNTPLRWVVDGRPQRDTLVFQVDLWSSRGELPRNMAHVNTRQKEIIYSSRTRAASTRFSEMQCVRNSISELLKALPPELIDAPQYAVLRQFAERKVWNLIQLIYRAKNYEGDSKDYEFSRLSMVDHWRAGYDDTVRTLAYPAVLERPRTADGVSIFDIAEHEGE
jgi:NTE family protein